MTNNPPALRNAPIVDDPTSTAYHEAGHAVIAMVEKLAVVRVSVEPGDDTLGHFMYDTFPLTDEYRVERKLDGIASAEWEIIRGSCEQWRSEANARTVLAGNIAERMHNPHVVVEHGGGRDSHRFNLWLIELALDRNERRIYAQLLRMQTERKLREHWAAVGCIAHLLLDQGTLDGTELLAAFARYPACL